MNVLNFGLLSLGSAFLIPYKRWTSGVQLCIVLSLSLQTCFLVVRWYEQGHFPLSNLYESLFFLSWSLTAFLFWSLLTRGNQGLILMPAMVGINGFMLCLPATLKKGYGLVPALQSNWLQMHVVVMIGAYAFLICGCLFAIGVLVHGRLYSKEVSSSGHHLLGQYETWDNLSYRAIGLGFPLLTMGLLSGAVWANVTWGSYWSWDPKETWALITWFIFAIYLHTRLSQSWTQNQSAWVAVLGFITLWICYLGVNLLSRGLHSYGWFVS